MMYQNDQSLDQKLYDTRTLGDNLFDIDMTIRLLESALIQVLGVQECFSKQVEAQSQHLSELSTMRSRR